VQFVECNRLQQGLTVKHDAKALDCYLEFLVLLDYRRKLGVFVLSLSLCACVSACVLLTGIGFLLEITSKLLALQHLFQFLILWTFFVDCVFVVD
jgi:hypothetical protein